MCGRFTLFTTAQDLAEKFEVEIDKSLSPRYNIAPSVPILTIRKDEGTKERILDVMQWGLIPRTGCGFYSWSEFI